MASLQEQKSRNYDKYKFTKYTDMCSVCREPNEPYKLTHKETTTRADYTCGRCDNVYFVSWAD